MRPRGADRWEQARGQRPPSAGESGQAALLMLGVLAALLAGTRILFGFGQALGARGKHQRAADLAAVSAAQVMRRHHHRLFEPVLLDDGAPNPLHLSTSAYLSLARAAAERGARRNGVRTEGVTVEFPDKGFAPSRVTVTVRGGADVRLPAADGRDRVEVRARATAELTPSDDLGIPEDGGGYNGPLAYRQGKPSPHLFPRCRAVWRSFHPIAPTWQTGRTPWHSGREPQRGRLDRGHGACAWQFDHSVSGGGVRASEQCLRARRADSTAAQL